MSKITLIDIHLFKTNIDPLGFYLPLENEKNAFLCIENKLRTEKEKTYIFKICTLDTKSLNIFK